MEPESCQPPQYFSESGPARDRQKNQKQSPGGEPAAAGRGHASSDIRFRVGTNLGSQFSHETIAFALVPLCFSMAKSELHAELTNTPAQDVQNQSITFAQAEHQAVFMIED